MPDTQCPHPPRPPLRPPRPRRLRPRRRRRSRLALQRTRPPTDVHLQLQSDSPRMQPRRLPRLRRHAQRTDGRRHPRRQRQPGRAILRTEIRPHRPRRAHHHRLRPHRLDHALRRLDPRIRPRHLRRARLEEPSRARHRRRPAPRPRRRTRTVPRQARKETDL